MEQCDIKVHESCGFFCFILFRRWVLSGSSHGQWLLASQNDVHWLVPLSDLFKGSAKKVRCLLGAVGLSVGVLIATQ